MGCPLLRFPNHCTAQRVFPANSTLLLSPTMRCWWLLAKAVNIFLTFLCSSYSILNTSSSNALSFGDGILERRQYEDQGLGEPTPLTIICQPTQVRLTVGVTSSALLSDPPSTRLLSMRAPPCCPEGSSISWGERAEDYKWYTKIQA